MTQRIVILVNGLPGAGKTTLAPHPVAASEVSDTMWALLADVPGDAVLESCWPTDVRHFVVRHLQRARGRQPVEIWCEAPLETARRRFEARHPRHPIHGELLTDAEWERWRVTARPLQVGPTFRIDTTGPVDANAVVAWVNRQAVINPQEPMIDAISDTQA